MVEVQINRQPAITSRYSSADAIPKCLLAPMLTRYSQVRRQSKSWAQIIMAADAGSHECTTDTCMMHKCASLNYMLGRQQALLRESQHCISSSK